MKIRKEYFILIAIIIALALYLIFHTTDKTNYTLPKIPQISKKEISKVEISKQGASILLQKRDNKWCIAPREYPADTNKINNILGVIAKLTLTALVSESKNYNRYDLDKDKKITVKAWAGDELMREFELGKTASSYRHTFIKIAGDDGVYHALENFRDKFDISVDKLRDKTVLSFDKNQIGKITISNEKQSAVFTLKEPPVKVKTAERDDAPINLSTQETFWEGPEGKKADESKLNRLLSTLSTLRCQKYVDNGKKTDFTKPIYTLQLKGPKEYSLSIFAEKDKDAEEYPAVSSENDYPFFLSKTQADNIMKDPDELVKKQEKD